MSLVRNLKYFLLLVPVLTFAQSPVDSTDLNYNLDEIVVTGTRSPRLLKDSPIATRVLGALEIRRSDASNISDLLQSELPGIEFTYSMNQHSSLNLNGFGGNSVLFLLDGERLAGETLDNVDYSRLNLDAVSRVEIVKGASSSLYGSNAVGGVVNLITKEQTQPFTIDINGHMGAHGEKRAGALLGLKRGKFSNSLDFQYNTIDAIKLSEGAEGVDAASVLKTIYAAHYWNFKEKLTYTPFKKLKITARAGYYFRERESSETLHERYRSFNGGGKAELRISSSSSLELSYAFDQYDKSDFMTYNKLDIRDYSNVNHSVKTLYNKSFAQRLNLVAGADYVRDYLMTYQFSGGAKVQHTADCFAQAEWKALEKLMLIGGVRYDWFSDNKLSHVSPKFALMYRPLRELAIRASYADGFRAPSLKERYMVFDMANLFMIYGNPDLKPEQSHNFSLSGQYTSSHYDFSLIGYYNLVDNRITTAWNRSLYAQVYTNLSKLDVFGFEADLSASYECGLSFRASYSYTHESVSKGLPQLSSTRPHSVTVRLSYGANWIKNLSTDFSISGRVLSSVTCDEYLAASSFQELGQRHYPAYTLWNLAIGQDLFYGVRLSCRVDNLMNYKPKLYYSNSPVTTGTCVSVGLSVSLYDLLKRK